MWFWVWIEKKSIDDSWMSQCSLLFRRMALWWFYELRMMEKKDWWLLDHLKGKQALKWNTFLTLIKSRYSDTRLSCVLIVSVNSCVASYWFLLFYSGISQFPNFWSQKQKLWMEGERRWVSSIEPNHKSHPRPLWQLQRFHNFRTSFISKSQCVPALFVRKGIQFSNWFILISAAKQPHNDMDGQRHPVIWVFSAFCSHLQFSLSLISSIPSINPQSDM